MSIIGEEYKWPMSVNVHRYWQPKSVQKVAKTNAKNLYADRMVTSIGNRLKTQTRRITYVYTEISV